MNGQEIEQLGFELEKDSPYFRRAFGNDPGKFANSTEAERLATVKFDPSLGYNLASTYAKEGLALPSCVCRSAPLRINSYLLHSGHPEFRVAVAQSLHLPETTAARDLLRALLCCPDLTSEDVASHFHVDPDLVHLVDQCWWNFRDRQDEPGYVAQILYKSTRFPGEAQRMQDEAQAGLRLMRLGYERGHQAVLQVAGPLPLIIESVTNAMLVEQNFHTILSRSAIEFEMGLDTNLQDKALQLVVPVMKQQAGKTVDEDRRRGVAGMSLSAGVYESFMRIMQPDLQHRLAVQRGLDQEMAKAPQHPDQAPGAIEPPR